jgi:alpha-1,6-mannosyltransferase
MKILDVTEFYSERGGGVRSHLSLKGHVLCQLGHDHVVLAPGAQDVVENLDEMLPPRLARSGGRARVIRIAGPASPYDPTYHLLLNTHKIRRLVERERPDVLEIHSPYMAAIAALRCKRSTYGVRTFQWHSDFIDTYAGVLESKLPGSARAIARTATRPLWSLVRSIAKRCDATLVASAWQVAKLAAHGVPRVVHRPFGIEREIFRPQARSFERRRELLARAGHDAQDDAATIVVGVGRFAIEKRWDVVIDAFARVRSRLLSDPSDRRRDAVLVLFGDGPERARMEARARASGHADAIVLSGFEKDRAALAESLASADVLVHGCPFETFGLSIAEALSCGLPVVVPDAGGAAEMHDDASGETYAAGDDAACADALERVIDRSARDREALRAAATRAAQRLPSVEQHFEEQIDLYSELLAGATRSARAYA